MASRRKVYSLFFLLPCLLSITSQAWAELPLFSAKYQLTRSTIPIATISLSLQKTKSHFILESITEPLPPFSWLTGDIVIERSRWRYHEGFPQPINYLFKRTSYYDTSEVFIKFDWAGKKIETTTNGHSWKMLLPEKTLDKALVQLALMIDTAKGLSINNYAVADGGRLKPYRFTLLGEETIESLSGKTTTLKINRSKSGKPATTTLWLAAQYNYLPVKIEKVRKGKIYTMSLVELSQP